MWYFTGQGQELADIPIGHDVSVFKAFRWGIWYHCGSLAFGSFLIALVQMIRIIFNYICYQLEKVGEQNPVYKAVKIIKNATPDFVKIIDIHPAVFFFEILYSFARAPSTLYSCFFSICCQAVGSEKVAFNSFNICLLISKNSSEFSGWLTMKMQASLVDNYIPLDFLLADSILS